MAAHCCIWCHHLELKCNANLSRSADAQYCVHYWSWICSEGIYYSHMNSAINLMIKINRRWRSHRMHKKHSLSKNAPKRSQHYCGIDSSSSWSPFSQFKGTCGPARALYIAVESPRSLLLQKEQGSTSDVRLASSCAAPQQGHGQQRQQGFSTQHDETKPSIVMQRGGVPRRPVPDPLYILVIISAQGIFIYVCNSITPTSPLGSHYAPTAQPWGH